MNVFYVLLLIYYWFCVAFFGPENEMDCGSNVYIFIYGMKGELIAIIELEEGRQLFACFIAVQFCVLFLYSFVRGGL